MNGLLDLIISPTAVSAVKFTFFLVGVAILSGWLEWRRG
jgi:hypothetical protein